MVVLSTLVTCQICSARPYLTIKFMPDSSFLVLVAFWPGEGSSGVTEDSGDGIKV